MPLLRSCILFLSATSFLTSALARTVPGTQQHQPKVPASNGYDHLMESVANQRLHETLESLHPAFRKGVYEGDGRALEALHRDDPSLATRLVSMAKLELVRRQNFSATATPSVVAVIMTTSLIAVVDPSTTIVSSVAVVKTSVVEPAASSSAGAASPSATVIAGGATTSNAGSASTTPVNIIIPIAKTSVNAAGSTTVINLQETIAATASIAVPYTTTNSKGQTVVATINVPAVIYLSTNSKGSTIASTSPLPTAGAILGTGSKIDVVTTIDKYGHTVVLSDASAGAVITTTDADGILITTTYYPPGGAVRSLIVETITGPGGSREVVTATDYIVPSVAGLATEAAATGTATSTVKPGLQTGAASATGPVGMEWMALLGGAIGFAWLL